MVDGFIEIDAAVLRAVGAPFRIERLALAEPRDDEVLVRLSSVGICHTDLAVAHGHFPMPLPFVLGHEGAGIVVAAGGAVERLAPGDPVVLSFSTCGACGPCVHGDMVYCEQFPQLNFGGRRPDGSATLRDAAGEINGRFFGQSSFASHAVVRARDVVKVPADVPLDLLGPLGCGFQTGAGTVINVLRPGADSTLAVLGVGAVGLAAVMAARHLGCGRIVAIDRNRARLDLARDLGATDLIRTDLQDLAAALADLGGIDFAVETTGVPALVATAIAALRTRGICALHGMTGDTKLEIDIRNLLGGRTVIGVREGHADPQQFIPLMIQLYRDGAFPIDRLIRFYPFDQIEAAIAASVSGHVVKPVLQFGATR